MKKIWMIFIGALILSLLFACTLVDVSPTDPSDDTMPDQTDVTLIDKLKEYQQKVETIIEAENASITLTSRHEHLELPPLDDPFMISRDEYMAIYSQQRENMLDVSLDAMLSQYKTLLDEVIIELETMDIESVQVEIEIEYRDMQSMRVYIELMQSGSIVIKLNASFQHMSYYAGIKFGYEADDFYLRELTRFDMYDYYEYFEFYENHYMINLRYSPESYWYRYQNQHDRTFYEISETSYYGDKNRCLTWFNPETNIRTIIVDGEDQLYQIEFFNEKGIYFSFTESMITNSILLSWQLLEATGWDYVYHQENTLNPYNGIYADGEKIFSDARTNIDLTFMFANVRIAYEVKFEDITNDMINLSMYGLTFNYQDLDIDEILYVRDHALLESAYLSVYHGIDFLNDDLSQVLYDVIDDDIKP